jgi:D-aminopeptidase
MERAMKHLLDEGYCNAVRRWSLADPLRSVGCFGLLSLAVLLGTVTATTTHQEQAPGKRVRARDLGIIVGIHSPGPENAITDVAGVLVGHATIIRGNGPLRVGEGPVRTGVTAVLPRKDIWFNNVLAATYTLNGNGEMTGIHKIRDFETLGTPVLVTNTGSVGAAYRATYDYMKDRHPRRPWDYLPVVAETWDAELNDLLGQHVHNEEVFQAIDTATGGPVTEGNVGGGTGMICYQFKGGIGTSSRRVSASDGGYTVGVLLQANFGRRHQLIVNGIPVGREMTDLMPVHKSDEGDDAREGSVIVVVATDAPLSSRQLERLARRVSLGLARTGSASGNSSGDIFIAFSTANVIPLEKSESVHQVSQLSVYRMDPLFEAVVEATEEAVLNALTKAETMTGINGNTVYALPYDRLTALMQKYGRTRQQ